MAICSSSPPAPIWSSSSKSFKTGPLTSIFKTLLLCACQTSLILLNLPSHGVCVVQAVKWSFQINLQTWIFWKQSDGFQFRCFFLFCSLSSFLLCKTFILSCDPSPLIACSILNVQQQDPRLAVPLLHSSIICGAKVARLAKMGWIMEGCGDLGWRSSLSSLEWSPWFNWRRKETEGTRWWRWKVLKNALSTSIYNCGQFVKFRKLKNWIEISEMGAIGLLFPELKWVRIQ